MRRLYPSPSDDVSVRQCYDVARPRPADRPWLMLCMVSSVDGSTVIDQRSAALSSPEDVEVLHTLRSLADVIVVGASTVRLEGYGAPARRGQRVGVVSRTGRIDTESELFTSGAGFLILPEDAPSSSVPTIRAGRGSVDLRNALAQLDVDLVQAEGGAALNGALGMADLLDEVNLTISPMIAGGTGPRLLTDAEPLTSRLTLAHLLEADGFLFTRYLRADLPPT